MPGLSGVTKIAFDAFTKTAAQVLKFSRTKEAKKSDDEDLRKLYKSTNSGSGKYGNFNWDAEYATKIINNACATYNAQVNPKDRLTPAKFASTYLPERTVNQNRSNWISYAKLADETSPLELIPTGVRNESKIGNAAKNEKNGLGFTTLFREDYESEDLKDLFLLLEKLTLKKREGKSIKLTDITKRLRKYFPALGNKKQSILLAIQNFVSAEKIQEEYCESTIGGDEYTPEEIAKKFQGEIDALLDALDAFLKGRNIDGTNGNAALRKLGIVNNVNDFFVVAEALFQGIQISLDVVIKKKVYPVSVGVTPETSIIINQKCPGMLERDIGCKCQIEQPFQILTSVVHILATGIFLDMDSGIATPGTGHSNGYVADAAEYAVPLELGKSHRVICKIKFGEEDDCPLGSFEHKFPATRSTSGGVYPHPELVPPESQYSCSNCRNTNMNFGNMGDFYNRRKPLRLHRACRLIQLDTALMLFNGPYAPKVKDWLERQGAECLEDVFGYLKDRPPASGMYQRKSKSSNTLGAQREGKATDVEHPKGRFTLYHHLPNATFFCSHTSNEVYTYVREDAKDFCYGFMAGFTYETKASRALGTVPGSKKKPKSTGKKRARSESDHVAEPVNYQNADAEILDQPTKKVKYTITQGGKETLQLVLDDIANSVCAETQQQSKKDRADRAQRRAAGCNSLVQEPQPPYSTAPELPSGQPVVGSNEQQPLVSVTTQQEAEALASQCLLSMTNGSSTVQDDISSTKDTLTTQSSSPTIEDTSKFNQQETTDVDMKPADVEMKPVDVEPSSSNEGSTCHSTSSATTRSDDMQLMLVPIRDTDEHFSSSVNDKQAYFEGGVASIVSGATPNYNAPRNTIKVTKEIRLGRNNTTCIQDSFISRDLCSINLTKSSFGSVRALLKMNMPCEIDEDGVKRYGHAVHLNGKHLDIAVGVERELYSGDILSLFGPLGFAYQVNL